MNGDNESCSSDSIIFGRERLSSNEAQPSKNTDLSLEIKIDQEKSNEDAGESYQSIFHSKRDRHELDCLSNQAINKYFASIAISFPIATNDELSIKQPMSETELEMAL